jgi:hypothetical protein
MKRQIIQKLLLFYPAKWRREYGAEFEDLLSTEPLRPAVILDVIVGALRQQVRMSNHPASTSHSLALMIGGLRAVFAAGALLYGVRTIGYWVILQVGGVRQAESSGIALVMYRSAFLFVVLSAASAYLRERTSGARAAVKTGLYLTGAFGIPPIVLFTVVSKGAILRMPEIVGLLVLFVGFILVFRSPNPKHND